MSGGFTPKLITTSDNVNREASFLASDQLSVKRCGITLDAATVTADGNGDKVLKAGTFVSKITATGKYGPYASGASDGRQTPSDDTSGYLLESVNLRDGDVIAGCLLNGSVLSARVTPTPDATIKAAVKGRIQFQ